jgi:hypothetical protein
MSNEYAVISGVPVPPIVRGRKMGDRGRDYDARVAAIHEDAALVMLGEFDTVKAAAEAIQHKYPRKSTGIKHLARLISFQINEV